MAGKVVDFAAHRFGPGAGTSRSEPDADCAVEQSLLGTLLAKPSLLAELPSGFGPHHFHYPDHDAVFEAIRNAAASGAGAITPLVRAALPHLDVQDEDGKPYSYVVSLLSAMVGTLPGMASAYAERVMEAHARRELLAVADRIREEVAPVGAEPASPNAVVAKIMIACERILGGQAKSSPAVSVGAAMREALALGQEAADRGGLSGVSTGLECLDRRIGGMEPGTVTVLGARPGVGKTALGLKIALNAAQADVPTLFVSLEMPAAQVGRRALALAGNVRLTSIKTGAFMEEPGAADEAVRAMNAWAKLPLLIEEEGGLTIQAIRLRAKSAARRMGGLGLLAIDHLHIMGLPESAGRHGATQAVTEVSAGIKALSKELNVPVLLLAQLNRGVEGREDKRPGLADLRQSGAIEQDADTIMFIYRKSYYTETREDAPPKPRRRGDPGDDVSGYLEGPTDRAEILFEKVRDGERGVEYLRYDAPRARFWEEGERA